MKEYICYILYGDEPKQIKLSNDRFIIKIIKINDSESNYNKADCWFCGTRYTTVYCDIYFTKSIIGQMMIKNIFKPSANIGNCEFYLI